MPTIGRFEIQSEIGRGSMGVVYLAHDPRVRRQVAVKTYHLPEGLSAEQQEEYRARFLREAQAAGALSHPGIVTIYDVDQDPATGQPFIAMEYVPGRSLAEILKEEGRLDPDRAVAMHRHLAEALRAAHAARVVHRDIKPANILVRESDGVVKIADFGVARLSTSNLTRTGSTIGSPAYMSPEQVRAEPMDGRSDLFSLAVILYQALTGERPFAGDDIAAVVYAVAHETHRPASRLVPGLPRGLDAFFDRALAKAPADRFPDGQAFARGLEEAMSPAAGGDADATVVSPPLVPQAGAPERSPNTRAERSWPPGVRAAVLILAVLLGTWALLRGDSGPPPAPGFLELEARSRVEGGRLSVVVDGTEVYTRELSLPRRGPKFLKKKLPLFGQESFDARIPVDPGRHKVVARVYPEDSGSAYTGRTRVRVASGQSARLRLDIGTESERELRLTVE